MTAIFERRAFRPMDETSVPSMRIVPTTGQKRGERRGERKVRKRRDEKLRMVFR